MVGPMEPPLYVELSSVHPAPSPLDVLTVPSPESQTDSGGSLGSSLVQRKVLVVKCLHQNIKDISSGSI